MSTSIPNVFIVGFQKCGSSTLYQILKSHPEISVTNPKETYFLADKDFDHFNSSKNITNPNADWNQFIFETKPNILEASVCNFYQKNAFEFIKKNKGSKVIFILRDPVDRFISVYKYKYGKIHGIPSNINIDDFFELVKTGNFEKHLIKFAIEHGKYKKYITLWENEIGKENILLVGMKQLINSPEKQVNEIYKFLNLKNDRPISIPHNNRSKSFRFPILNKYMVKLFGGSFLSNKLTKYLYNKYFTKIISPVLNSDIKKQLVEIYTEEYKYYSKYF